MGSTDMDKNHKPVETQIIQKLQKAFEPEVLSVKNESPRHNVPPGAESHFAVLLVSDCFVHQTRVQRHRNVMDVLKLELKTAIHALSLRLMTSSEYKEMGQGDGSPPCQKKK